MKLAKAEAGILPANFDLLLSRRVKGWLAASDACIVRSTS